MNTSHQTMFRQLRWLLAATVLFLNLFSPVAVEVSYAQSSSNSSSEVKNDLNLNNAYSNARQVGGFTVMKAMFMFFMAGCLMVSLSLAAIGILSYQKTHQWDKLQSNMLAIVFFVILTGVFGWLFAMENSTQGVSPIITTSVSPINTATSA